MSAEKDKTQEQQAIFVVAPKSLNSALLAYGLEREGLGKTVLVDEVEVFREHRDAAGKRAPLVLVDAQHTSHDKLLLELQSAGFVDVLKYLFAVFNLEPGTPCDQEALIRGVRGFFYQYDSLELFFKGIRSILAGEVWVSRGSLLNWVLQGKPRKPDPKEEKTLLTRREMEILALVSSGARNDDIADKLYISSHTVKTHLYNIFKKIDVPNRLQAALWASKNL